ncbi:MAG: type II CAAX endopeptidase family protein, partial [Planctomycetota bacterium]
VACSCSNCGRNWTVHRDLSGYRVRCDCGNFITVSAALEPVGGSALDLLTRSNELDMSVPRSEGLFAPSTAPREVALDRALEPAALEDAKNEIRSRWTSRTILELVLFMLAFLAPGLIVMLFTSGTRQALYMPIASLASSLCVIAVGMLAPGYTFGSLSAPRPRYFLEAAGAWIVAVGFAFFWMYLLKQAFPEAAEDAGSGGMRAEIGTAMTLFVVALCPGIFEELAFRGLIQGRLGALFGSTTAIVITGIAFGWAHGITAGFPIHLGLGLYLCWLRARSASLIPGMLLHACYNATMVLGMP